MSQCKGCVLTKPIKWASLRKLQVLFILLAFFLYSCSYNATIVRPDPDEDFAEQFPKAKFPKAKAKYDLRAAIVIKPPQMDEVIHVKAVIYSVNFRPYPVMYQIIEERMRNVFPQVTLIEEGNLKEEDFDILIYTSSKIAMDCFYSLTFSIKGYDARSKQVLFDAISKQEKGYVPPPGLFIAMILIPIFLPVGISITMDAVGKQAEKAYPTMLSDALEKTIRDISKSSELKLFAARLKGEETSE